MTDSQPSARDFLVTLLEQKEMLKIIVTSMSDTISRFTGTPVIAGKPFLKDKCDIKNIAVAGLIRFNSDAMAVELFLGFSNELFVNLYEKIFQMNLDGISEENQDLAGEILNVAFGDMDPKFRKLGFNLKSSFPEVYSQVKLAAALKSDDIRAVVIPYTSGGKTFNVEVYSAGSLQVQWKYDKVAS